MSNSLQKILQEAERSGFWGQVQVDYQNGKPVVVRKTETTKLREEDNTRDDQPRYNTRQSA
jgi:hypothetical protein